MSSHRSPVENHTPATRSPWYEKLEERIATRSDILAASLLALGFGWRIWLAQATFFNTDEAWHFSVANQDSLAAAFKASLTLAHPPLMILLLYFWKHLVSSDAMLRLPGVLAGTLFCWVFHRWLGTLFGNAVAWCGLIFSAFLPPMIVLSAELRQYSWVLLFAVASAYFLERGFARDSARALLLSSVCLWLALLSHYSAFLFAASLGIYAVLRMIGRRPSTPVVTVWAVGQAVGVALAVFLVKTHVAKLASVYPGEPLHRFGDFYLAEVYFHPGRESLPHFLYRGTFGVFRFLCAQRTAGHLTTILFVIGIVLLLWRKDEAGSQVSSRLLALLLTLPFLLNWIAVVAGFYPYGRTRQCVYLAIFGIGGVGVTLARIAVNRISLALGMAASIVAICHLFGTPHSLDMLVNAEQRQDHMQQAIAFIRTHVSPADIVFTDKPTSFQLMHSLCGPRPVRVVQSASGFDSFDCDAIRVISTNLGDGSLTAQSFPTKLREMERSYSPRTAVWVVQAAWSSGLGETLGNTSEEFAGIEPQVFDRYIEIFQVPANAGSAAPSGAR
jgi:Dolichyl-phosphate-mannose-protein mannosyltransferase